MVTRSPHSLQRSRHHKALEANPEARATYRTYQRQQQQTIADGGKVPCWICRRWITKLYIVGKDNRMSLSIDHVRPYDDDDPSTWDITNLRTAHRACNARKGRTTGIAQAPEQPAEYTRW